MRFLVVVDDPYLESAFYGEVEAADVTEAVRLVAARAVERSSLVLPGDDPVERAVDYCTLVTRMVASEDAPGGANVSEIPEVSSC